MSKLVCLITTKNCAACDIQKSILEIVRQQRPDIDLVVCDYKEVPATIKATTTLKDFPTTIITDETGVMYAFVGTKTVNKIIELFNQLNC